MFLMSIVRDSNFSKKDNDEIFSVHLGPDVKFCIKIVLKVNQKNAPHNYGGLLVLTRTVMWIKKI